jgi:hypothetical protein
MIPRFLAVLMLAAGIFNGNVLCAEKGHFEITEPSGDQGRVPSAKLVPTTLVYGTIQIGTTSPPQTMTLTNPGPTAVTLAKSTPPIVLGGTYGADFAITSTTCTANEVLMQGQGCSASVTLTPSINGPEAGKITFRVLRCPNCAVGALDGRGSTTGAEY